MRRFFSGSVFVPLFNRARTLQWAGLLAAMVLAANCSSTAQKEKKLPFYDLDKPEKFFMPESLTEISGITFYKGQSDTIFGIQDEEGRLFRLPWMVKKQFNAKFGKKGDYEDLAILKETVVVLKSNGHLYSFPFNESGYEEIDSAREWKGLLPEGEYEGIFGDDASGKLYALCKNCVEDDNKETLSGFILQLDNGAIAPSGKFSIDVNSLRPFTGKVKRGFRPSALARNPVTGEWFIVSSVNKLLVVTNGDWIVQNAYTLNGNSFNQPEGIAFDKAGNLYISNEGDDLSQGNILKFARLSK